MTFTLPKTRPHYGPLQRSGICVACFGLSMFTRELHTYIYMETYMRRDTYILWWSMANSFSSKHGSGKWTLSLGKWWKMTCKSMIFHFMFISKRVHWDYITWDISPFKYGQMAPPCRGARMCRKHLAQIGEGHSRVVKQFVIDDMK